MRVTTKSKGPVCDFKLPTRNMWASLEYRIQYVVYFSYEPLALHCNNKCPTSQNVYTTHLITESSPSFYLANLSGVQNIKFVPSLSIDAIDGTIEYWATNDPEMVDRLLVKFTGLAWMIETYHRGIKQFCGIERCQARSATAQRNHIELALRAFLRLKYHTFINGMSWFEAKNAIVREAVRAYISDPIYVF